MENIFEGIKFSDRFRTRNNHMVVFLHGQKETPRSRKIEYVFAHDDWGINHIVCDKTGKSNYGSEYDIVSRWEKPIDEEKLDELAREYAKEIPFKATSTIESEKYWAYKAGFYKAKENECI